MKEAIIYIPGAEIKAIGQSLDEAVKALTGAQRNYKIENSEDIFLGGLYGKGLSVRHTEKDLTKVDIFEVYWGDILEAQNPSNQKALKKVLWGFDLLVFWWFSRIWKAILSNRYMLLWLLASTVLMILWYFSVVVLGLKTLMDSIPHFLDVNSISLPEWMDIDYKTLFQGDIKLYLLATAILSLFPINILLHISGFVKDYLTKHELRNQICTRITQIMNSIEKNKEYKKITILGYSIGTLMALDFLASYQKNNDQCQVEFISVGSASSFLRLKSNWVKTKQNDVIKNKNIDQWHDYFSPHDWLCSYEGIEISNRNFKSYSIESDINLLDRFTTKVHQNYFHFPKVAEGILAKK